MYTTKGEITEWIMTTIKQCGRILPEELLDEKDVLSQIVAAEHPCDKAIIATWYDAAGRVTELGMPQIKRFVPDEYGFVPMVKGKTGMYRVRLVFSAPYISA